MPTAATNAVADPPEPTQIDRDNSNISRSDFSQGFIFGTGTSAYQVEGAYAQGGKSLSIWDSLIMNNPSMITDGSNGNVACDMYHRYKEDIANMKRMGFDYYRFSISWPRILPGGRTSMGINREGIEYYSELIDTVIANGLQPFVTLFHFDLPNSLQNEYGGFLSRRIVEDFREFAEICFWEFGNRVKFWTTFNEPWTNNVNGYVNGIFAQTGESPAADNLPSHRMKQDPVDSASATSSTTGSTGDVYTAARNMLLAHSAAVELYRARYQVYQHGKIGIVLNSNWYIPLNSNSTADVAAANRAVDFMLGWYLEPVLYGHYPQSMIDFVPPQDLAPFSPQESEMLKGSIDFLGLNYYTSNYVVDAPHLQGKGYNADQKLTFSTSRDGKLIGEQSGSSWLYITPWGIYQHLIYMNNTYKDLPPVYITENGVSSRNDTSLTIRQASSDPTRVKYHQDHLAYLLRAIKEGVDVRGYFVWAYCDNFEWAAGYASRFGIMYIDYRNNLTRYPKDSAVWFAKFLKGGAKKSADLGQKRQLDEDDNGEAVEKRSKRVKQLSE